MKCYQRFEQEEEWFPVEQMRFRYVSGARHKRESVMIPFWSSPSTFRELKKWILKDCPSAEISVIGDKIFSHQDGQIVYYEFRNE